jgi:hypothetical protein
MTDQRDIFPVVAAPGLEPGCRVGPQILSPPKALLLKFFGGHAFHRKSPEMPMTSAEIH